MGAYRVAVNRMSLRPNESCSDKQPRTRLPDGDRHAWIDARRRDSVCTQMTAHLIDSDVAARRDRKVIFSSGIRNLWAIQDKIRNNASERFFEQVLAPAQAILEVNFCLPSNTYLGVFGTGRR